jgi:hypothetical protein
MSRAQPAALNCRRCGLDSSTWRSRPHPDTLTARSAAASGSSRRDRAVQPVRSRERQPASEAAAASSPAGYTGGGERDSIGLCNVDMQR